MNALAVLSAVLVASVFWHGTAAFMRRVKSSQSFLHVFVVSHLLSLTVLLVMTGVAVGSIVLNDISLKTVCSEMDAQQVWRGVSMLVGTSIMLASIIGVWLANCGKRSKEPMEEKVSGTENE